MKKSNKKAQMKINQMVFMIIAITVLLALVGLFALQIRLGGIKKTADQLENENAKLLVSKLANSPEFSCGESFQGQRASCLDLDKVMALKSNITKYEHFWSTSSTDWGVTKIEIRIVHSILDRNPNERECTYDFETLEGTFPECDYIQLMEVPSDGNDHSNYVTLCKRMILPGQDRAQTVCSLGELIVRYKDAK